GLRRRRGAGGPLQPDEAERRRGSGDHDAGPKRRMRACAQHFSSQNRRRWPFTARPIPATSVSETDDTRPPGRRQANRRGKVRVALPRSAGGRRYIRPMAQGHSTADYLETIYFLAFPVGEYGPVVRDSPALAARVAEMLGVSAPSASEMLKRLEGDGLIERGARKEALLTARGRAEA